VNPAHMEQLMKEGGLD